MTQSCKTVTILTEQSKENPSGHVIINESDFNPETMTLADDEAPAEEDPKVPANAEAVNQPVVPPVEASKEAAKVVAPWAAK